MGSSLLLSPSLPTMSALPMTLAPRRSERPRVEPQSIGAEMEYRRLTAEHQALMRRLAREPIQYDTASDSDEAELAPESDSSADEEEDNKENVPPASGWLPDTHDVGRAPCTAQAEVKLPRHRARTELGYFRCFVLDTLVAMMVTNTNAYAEVRGAAPPFVTDEAEMWRYIAARIRMGIARLPQMSMYWEAEYRDSYVTQLFTRDRFLLLQRYWHIAPPTPAGVKQTAIQKISPLYRGLQDLFQAHYIPGGNLAVDESMVRCKGRTPWKATIREKPTSTGYKMYTIASDGYLLGYDIYRGKGGYDTPHAALQHTVVKLAQPFANQLRTLYMDNLYTSPTLCDDLLQMGIRSCGTCRANRRALPPRIGPAMKQLDKGEYKAWQRGQLGCLAWHSAKPIIILSTHHRVDHFVTVTHGDGLPDELKPQVAVDYNNNKGHVDGVDQMRQYYGMERRVQRTWPSLAWWLLDMCIVNAYTLCSLDNNTHTGQLHFRQQLMHQIAALFPSSLTHVQPNVSRGQRLHPLGHWPRDTHQQRNCKHCSTAGQKRKRSQIECELCGVHLCRDPCFKLYHVGQEQGS